MTYETYTMLMNFLQAEALRVHQEVFQAISVYKAPSAGAWSVYAEKITLINQARKELREAAQAAVKDHSDPKVREFWGSISA